MLTLLWFSILVVSSKGYSDDYVINNKKFPSDFMFGVSTAAYQIEGGWDEGGKSMSIWDNITHSRPDYIKNKDNGDIACDSYHKLEEDVRILKELGVSHYRFSLSWTRILPDGMGTKVNEEGVAYYTKLLTLLKNNSIEPVVTLYHWDLPQVLQDKGGFLTESIVDWFSDYARICFERFGPLVRFWLTFNEAKQVCSGGYGYGHKAPAIKSEGLLEYVCAHNLLKAHATVYSIYNVTYRASQKGKISIAIDTAWYEPASNKTEDVKAAETKMDFEFGWFAHPIILGDYPESMKVRIANRSKAEGYNKTRLPKFSEADVKYIQGTYDYLGINIYSTNMVKAIPEPAITIHKPSRYGDIGVFDYVLNSWKNSTLEWLKVVPFGMRKLMKYVKDAYKNPDILITENGVCDYGNLKDDDRIYYIQNYVSYLRDAIEKDKVKVFGYSHWSVMDNFEWNEGYSQKFGLYHVDFSSKNRTRTPKKSASYYQHLCRTHCLVDKCVD